MAQPTGTMIHFTRPDGQTTPAYLVDGPAGRPGIVLIQEWWGLNEHIKGVAERLSGLGYTVLAPDLYRGRTTTAADEANHLMTGLDFADATHQDLQGAVNLLAAKGAPVGVMGFCMGGALTVAASVHVTGLQAAVCFYGIPPAEFADPARIRIPFQGHFADQDDWCTPAAVDGLVQAMAGAPTPPEVHRYPAQHAFFNHSRPEVYDAACAEQAWSRMQAFWRAQLG
jgi:carboxymethylenebutenolidase